VVQIASTAWINRTICFTVFPYINFSEFIERFEYFRSVAHNAVVFIHHCKNNSRFNRRLLYIS